MSETIRVVDAGAIAAPSPGRPGMGPARRLRVAIDEATIGQLFEAGGVWGFEYDASWLQREDSFDLAPSIKRQPGAVADGSTYRPIQNFFDNLLPEEDLRILIARDAGIDPADRFALLAHYGRETAGALSLFEPDSTAGPATRNPLPDKDLQQRIDKLPRASLASTGRKKMSLAGAQHKLAIIMQPDGSFLEPVGAEPSTHILKPEHPRIEEYPHSVINEWFCMTLAGALGLDVPTVARRYVPSPVYVVTRFDRHIAGDGTVRRLYAMDGCQMLGYPATSKYKVTVEMLADACRMCTVPAQALLTVAQWLIFNCLIGNGDCHLKNISFLPATRGRFTVAPVYDLLSTAAWDMGPPPLARWPNASGLAFPIGAATTFGNLTRAELIAFLEQMNVKPAIAGRLLDNSIKKIGPAVATLRTKMEAENAALTDSGKVPAGTLAGEVRHVAQIAALVAEMSSRLR